MVAKLPIKRQALPDERPPKAFLELSKIVADRYAALLKELARY